MKNKIIALLVLSLTLAFSSCEDFLTDTPESALTQVDFYTTPIRINSGVIGCYNGLAAVTNNEWRFTELRTDNTNMSQTGSSSNTNLELADLTFFRPSTAYPILQEFWYSIFQNISNVSAVLPSVADTKYISNESLRSQYEAELLFIRALHYYKLVNLFGDMFKITTVIGPNEAKRLTRRPAEEIYNDIIIPDLIKAANQAPASYSATEKGRVTNWAAKSLLAKVYITIGGDANLALAKTLLEDVINNSGHKLTTGASAYADVFSTAKEMNEEIIFAVRYKGGSDNIGSPFFGLFAPYGSSILITKVGTPSGYNSPTYELDSLFSKVNAGDKRTATSLAKYKAGKTIYNYVCKYTDSNQSAAFQAENDWIEIRMADVKLLLAEVLAQGSNPDAARPIVNEIRARAGISPYLSFADKIEALDSVYQERRLELAFENHRFFDLLRMNKSYNNPNKAMEIMKKHTFVTDSAFYALYSPNTQPRELDFINNRLLLPIPQSEIDTNNEIEVPQNISY